MLKDKAAIIKYLWTDISFRKIKHFSYIWAVGTPDALEEDEGAEDDDADGAKDVPGLASVEDPAEEEVVILVREVADEDGGDAVGDLAGQEDESGVRVVEFQDLKPKPGW